MRLKKHSLGWWQVETLAVTMVGYALYYLIRKNFSLAMPLLTETYGISKVQLGTFLTLHGIVYGFARFSNGILTDRSSARKVMAAGLFICSCINIAFGFSDVFGNLVYTMGILWVINGYFQGMGVPPCIKTLPQWFAKEQLASRQSVWNLSHSLGAGCALAICGWLVAPHLSWRWCFLIPAAVSMAGSVGIWFCMKDSPTDVGLPPVSVAKIEPVKTAAESAAYKAYITKWVFRNPYVWIIAVADFFVYVVRFAALDWGPTLLVESKGISLAAATTLCICFEIVGGNIGMLVFGWLTDRYLKSYTHRTSVLCMFGAAAAIAGFAFVPSGASLPVMLLPFMLIGFFIYGPQALLGVAVTQQATPRAAGAACGVQGILSYLSTILSGIGFGFVAQRWGWNAAYGTIFAAAIIGALILLPMWNRSPHQGEAQ